MNKSSIIALFLTASFLFTCIGCAFGTREVFLKNTEPVENDTSTVTRNHQVCFDGLSDARAEPNIGHVQNGYGVHTADIVATSSVADWVNIEITNRLISAGYNVNKDCSPSTNSLTVAGKVVKVYTTVYTNFLGEVTIDASISRDRSRIIDKNYSGHTKKKLNMTASAEDFGDILKQSLDTAVTRLIHDIDSLDHIDFSSPYATTEDLPVAPLQMSDTSVAHYLRDSTGIDCPEKNKGILVISGARQATLLKRTTDSIYYKLNRLYNDRFELNPSLQGELCVYFEIDVQGQIDNISLLENTLNDTPIEEELASLLSSKNFKKIRDESDLTRASWHLVFSAESAKSRKSGMIAGLFILALIPLIFSIINLSNTL